MAKRFEAKNAQEAWNMANAIFPADYTEDTDSTVRAGYPIYRSNVEYYDYICDLGDRLEINLKNGNKTINIWIVKEEAELPKLPTKEETKEVATHQYTFEPEQVQLVKVVVSECEAESEANKAVYKAMKANEGFRKEHIAGDLVEAYCKYKGIDWVSIRVIQISHYVSVSNSGRYVIEAIVGVRV